MFVDGVLKSRLAVRKVELKLIKLVSVFTSLPSELYFTTVVSHLLLRTLYIWPSTLIVAKFPS